MIDSQLIFDGTIASSGVPTGVALTTTRVSTNVLDLLVARDLGVDALLGIQVQVNPALTGGTSLQIDAEVCATAGGSYAVLNLSPVIPAAQLIAGSPIFRVPVPLNQVLNATAGILAAPGRFIRLNYTIVGTFTAGAIFSWMAPNNDRQQLTTYPSNYAVQIPAGEI